MTDPATTINNAMIDAVLLIHRIARRALSEEERVGQRMLRDPRGEVTGLLVQMAAIENIARRAFPEGTRELLDLAAAKEEAGAIRAEGRKTH